MRLNQESERLRKANQEPSTPSNQSDKTKPAPVVSASLLTKIMNNEKSKYCLTDLFLECAQHVCCKKDTIHLLPLEGIKSLSIQDKTEWIVSIVTYHHEVQIIDDLISKFEMLLNMNLNYSQYEHFTRVFAREYFIQMKGSTEVIQTI